MNKHNEKLKTAALKRGRQILAMKERGATWAEIGAILKISRQRAQQIAARTKE